MPQGGGNLTDEHRHAVNELDRHIEAFNEALRETECADETLESVGPLLGEFDIEDVRQRIEERREKARIICAHLTGSSLPGFGEGELSQDCAELDSVFEQVLEQF